jgi:hypothetical protein
MKKFVVRMPSGELIGVKADFPQDALCVGVLVGLQEGAAMRPENFVSAMDEKNHLHHMTVGSVCEVLAYNGLI